MWRDLGAAWKRMQGSASSKSKVRTAAWLHFAVVARAMQLSAMRRPQGGTSPKRLVRMDTFDTSTSMRGRIFHELKNARFSRTVKHVSLPPL